MPQKQVPEGQVPSKDEQHQQLLEKMAGNDVFRRCRGQLGKSVLDVLLEIIRGIKTRSEFRKRFDSFHGDLRVLGNWIAQYNLNGWDIASKALSSCLEDDRILLPGEIVPVDQTHPITVMMFEPEKTMKLLQLLQKYSEVHIYRCAAMYKNKQGLPNHSLEAAQEAFPELASYIRGLNDLHQIFEVFPSFKKACFDDIDFNPEPDDLYARPFDELFKALENAYQKDVIDQFLLGAPDEMFSHSCGNGFPVKCLFRWNADQKKVLKLYSRVQRKQMAVWYIDFPDILHDGNMVFGVHEEKAHSILQKQYPAICSKGVSHGFGTIALMSHKSGIQGKYNMFAEENDSVLQFIFK